MTCPGNVAARIVAKRYVRTGTVAIALVAAIFRPQALAADEAKPAPERFSGNIVMVGGPVGGTARIRITVERWSTDEERKSLLGALRQGGTDGLVGAMDKLEVGYVQVNDSLRWPLRFAVTRPTEKGRVVRVATNRPILFGEARTGSRTMDYPIGLAEFTLPPDGSGEGTLIGAAQVRFDDQGQIEVTTTPQNTSPQRLLGVRVDVPKEKKKKGS